MRESATGRRGTHHVDYELVLPDGRVLRTRVSHPPNRSSYGSAMWAHILRDQLDVTEREFWDCVKDGLAPDRGVSQPVSSAIPVGVAISLVNTFHIPESEVRAMTREQAIDRLAECYRNQ
ncbi:MAG: cytotoxic translational repressor of toxin-antitoxin stability system [Dermatophilaceae bacterium]